MRDDQPPALQDGWVAGPPTHRPPRRALRPGGFWLGLLVGVAAVAVGLLPWLLTGARLPLQNLTPAGAPDRFQVGGDAPLVLLPFSQYAVVLIAAMLLVGAGLAALVGRALRRRFGARTVLAALLAVVAVQSGAVVQSAGPLADAVRDAPQTFSNTSIDASGLYVGLLVAGAVGSILVGAVLLLLVGLAPRPLAVILLATLALAVTSWARALVSPPLSAAEPRLPEEVVATMLVGIRYAPGVLVGLAIAWAGIRSVGRVIAAVLALVVFWVGTALVTATSFALGSRVLLRDPAELVSSFTSVFQSALGPAGDPLPVLVTAAIVGVVGALLVDAVTRRHRRARRLPS